MAFFVYAIVITVIVLGGLILAIRQPGRVVYVYREKEPPGEEDEDSPRLFFDDNDLAAKEAETENPGWHGTVVDLNGVRVGKDGMTEPRRRTFWQRLQGEGKG